MYSVIVPCYKSALTIRKVVELTSAKLEELGRTPYEFVLVDDNSPDKGETVRALRAALLQLSSLQKIPASIMP